MKNFYRPLLLLLAALFIGGCFEHGEIKSADANLKELVVAIQKVGSQSFDKVNLTPAYSPEITDYTVTVNGSELNTKITGFINPKAKMSNYSVEGGGQFSIIKNNIADGENRIVLEVKAENGTQKNYNVRIIKTNEKDLRFTKFIDWADKVVMNKMNNFQPNNDIISFDVIENIYFNFTYQLTGADLNKNTNIKVYIDNVMKKTYGINYMEGETAREHFKDQEDKLLAHASDIGVGSHELKIVLDDGNAIVETEEGNNIFTKTFTISQIADTTPTGLNAVGGYKIVELNWTAPNISGYSLKYKIYRSTNGTTFNEINTNNMTSFTDSPVTGGTTYYYKVQTILNSGIPEEGDIAGSESQVVQATPSNTPPAPTNLAATANIGGIDLSWSAPSISYSYAKYYKVYRSTDNVNFTVLYQGMSDYTTSGNSFRDSNVVSGTTYYYKVQTVIYDYNQSQYISGEYSTVENITASEIAPPTNLSASSGAGFSANLSWTAPNGLENYSVSYKIYRSTDGTNYNSIDSNSFNTQSTTFTDIGLTPGQVYYYKVQTVIYGQGTNWNYVYGGKSNDTSITLATIAAPTNLIAKSGYNLIDLSWTAPTGYSISNLKYRILRSQNNILFDEISIGNNQTTFTDFSAAGGTTYYYKVQTILNGPLTNFMDVFGSETQAVSAASSNTPPAATNLSAVGSIGGIDLSWTEPSISGNYGRYYKIYRSTDNATFTLIAGGDPNYTTMGSSYKDTTGVVSGTMYYYKVKTVIKDYNQNQYIEGGETTVANAAVSDIPAPTGLTAAAGIEYGKANLSWTAPAGLSAYSVYYKIYRSTDGTSFTAIDGNTFNTSDTSFTDMSLTPGVTYYFKVQTIINGQGTNWNYTAGSMSSAATVTAAAITAPTGLTATGGYKSVALAWTAPTGLDGYNVYYKIYRSTNGTSYSAISVNNYDAANTSYIDNPLTAPTTYYYQVKTVIQGPSTNWNFINGSTSTAANAVTTSIPDSPANVVATGNVGSIDLSWSHPAGLGNYNKYYKIYRSTDNITFTYLSSLGNQYGLSCKDSTNIVNGQTYYYKIRTVIEDGQIVEGADSSVVSAISMDIPAPTGLSAVQGSSYGKINLSWTAPTGLDVYEIYYKIYRSEDGSNYNAIDGSTYNSSTTSFIETYLTSGITYYYKVQTVIRGQATNWNFQNGAMSTAANSTAKAIPAPTAVTATGGYGKITLGWTAPSITGSYSKYYKIYRSTDNATYDEISTNMFDTSTTSYKDTSVVNGTTYYYKTKTVIQGADSNYNYLKGLDSAMVSAEPVLPPAANDFTVVNGYGGVKLSWAQPSGVSGYEVYYKIWRSTDDINYTYLHTGSDYSVYTTTYLDNTALSNNTYYYKVQTVIRSGETNWMYLDGDYTLSASGISQSVPVPAGVMATGGYKNVEITWTVPTGLEAYNVYYKIFRSTNGTTFSQLTTNTYDTSNTLYSDTSVSTGTTYYYKVKTVIYGLDTNYTYISSLPSIAASAVSSNVPGASSGLTAEADYGAVNLSWEAPGGLNNYSKYYKVYRSTDGTNYSYLNTGSDYSTTNTTYRDTAVTVGTTYYYKVLTKIYDSAILSYVTGTVDSNVSSTAPVGPPAPTGIAAIAGAGYGTLDISWNIPAGLDSYSIYYKVYRSTDGTTYTQISGNTYDTATNAYSDSSLPDGTVFYYKVKTIIYGSATNWNFISGNMSIAASGSPNFVPAPTALAAVAGYGRIDLTWTAPTGIPAGYSKYYKVYRSTDDISYSEISTNSYDTSDTYYRDINVISGTTYYYKIKTVVYGSLTNYNYVKGSNSTSASAIPTAVPLATGVGATSGYGGIGIYWTQPTGLSSYNVYYKVFRSTDNVNFSYLDIGFTYSSGTTSYFDTSVENGVTYYYKVKTVIYGSLTNYTYIESAELTTSVSGSSSLPPTVTGLMAGPVFQQPQQINLSWAQPSGVSGYEVYYKIYRSTDGTNFSYISIGSDYTTNNTSYLDNFLTNGVTYYYKVTTVLRGAITKYNYIEGNYSSVVSAVPGTSP